jgi:Na+-transporting NADH:ubiquinone oxidoreductase subunit NqrB
MLKDRIYEFFEKVHHQLQARRAEGLAVLWEGLKDSIFGGSEKSARQAPYIRDALGMQRYMGSPILVCIPLALASIYFYGWRSLAIIVVTYIVGMAVEFTFCAIRRHEITEGLASDVYTLCALAPAHAAPVDGRGGDLLCDWDQRAFWRVGV